MPWAGIGEVVAANVTKHGGPHVAWAELDPVNDALHILYSYRTVSTWTPPLELAVAIGWSGVAAVNINTLDNEGRLLVTWLDEGTIPGLHGRVWNLSEWETAVPIFEGFGVRTEVDHFPSAWEVHVASHTLQPACPCNDVLYASGTPGSWSTPESIGSGHTGGTWEWPQQVALHVGQDNVPHVIWRHETYDMTMQLVDERLIYGVRDGVWVFDQLIAAGRNAHDPGIGTSSSGDPTVVWCDDSGGSFDVYLATTTPPTAVMQPELATPAAPALIATIAPNPTRRGTTIEVGLPAAGALRAGIFDARGRRVATLGGHATGPGPTRLIWDGRSASGRLVPGGVYYVRIETDGGTTARRVVVVR